MSFLSGLIDGIFGGGNAASKAAKAQEKAANNATALQRDIYEKQSGLTRRLRIATSRSRTVATPSRASIELSNSNPRAP